MKKLTYFLFSHGLYTHSRKVWSKTREDKDRPYERDRLYFPEEVHCVVRDIGHDVDQKNYYIYCEMLETSHNPHNEESMVSRGWKQILLEEKHLRGLA